MNIFTANKQLMFNVSLEEIKKMTPQEAWLFIKHIKKQYFYIANQEKDNYDG